MGDPKENPRHSFVEKENREEEKLKESLSGLTEADFRYEEEKRNEMSHVLQLNMERTKEEFEILFTRL
jgi:hypothetical protein